MSLGTWFTRLVVATDLLFVSVWMFVVLPYFEPIASGDVVLHQTSVIAAVGLTATSVLIGLLQLWVETLRLIDRGPILNAVILFTLAALIVWTEGHYGG